MSSIFSPSFRLVCTSKLIQSRSHKFTKSTVHLNLMREQWRWGERSASEGREGRERERKWNRPEVNELVMVSKGQQEVSWSKSQPSPFLSFQAIFMSATFLSNFFPLSQWESLISFHSLDERISHYIFLSCPPHSITICRDDYEERCMWREGNG